MGRGGDGGQASAFPNHTGRCPGTTASPARQCQSHWGVHRTAAAAAGWGSGWGCPSIPGAPVTQIPPKGRGSHRAPPHPRDRRRAPPGGRQGEGESGTGHAPSWGAGHAPSRKARALHPPHPGGLTHPPPPPGTAPPAPAPPPPHGAPRPARGPIRTSRDAAGARPRPPPLLPGSPGAAPPALPRNPDSGRGPFKWRRRSEPSTRCNPTGGRRRAPIGCAERGTRSHWPRWSLGSRDSLTGGCRGKAERSPERGIGATAPDRDGRLENLGRMRLAERVKPSEQHGAGRGRRPRSGGARRGAGGEHGGGRGPERGAPVPAGARAATRKARSGSHGMGSPPRSPPPP